MFESLKKWLPFKFKRQEKNERSTEVATQAQAQAQSSMPVPMYWGPRWFQEMEERFDRLWQNALSQSPFRDVGQPGWFGDFSPMTFSPKIDVVDDKKNIVVTAELPGLSANEVEVVVQDGVLLLKGEKRLEKQHEEDGCYRTERAYGSFQRRIPLPGDINTDDVTAQFQNGVLELKFPKQEIVETQVKKIEIQS